MSFNLTIDETIDSCDEFRAFLVANRWRLDNVRFCVDFACLNANPEELAALASTAGPWLRKIEGLYKVMYRMFGYVRFHTMTLIEEKAEARA